MLGRAAGGARSHRGADFAGGQIMQVLRAGAGVLVEATLLDAPRVIPVGHRGCAGSPRGQARELARAATLTTAPQLLAGRAWSHAGINQAEVSVDRGVTWITAKLLNRSGPGNWSRFTYPRPSLSPGNYELSARATDNHLTTQPSTVPFNSAGYRFGAIIRHAIRCDEADSERAHEPVPQPT